MKHENDNGENSGIITMLKDLYRRRPIAFALGLMGLSTIAIIAGVLLMGISPSA